MRAAEALAPLSRAHDVVILHGNEPEVGLLAIESNAGSTGPRPYSLDVSERSLRDWSATGSPKLSIMSSELEPSPPLSARPSLTRRSLTLAHPLRFSRRGVRRGACSRSCGRIRLGHATRRFSVATGRSFADAS